MSLRYLLAVAASDLPDWPRLLDRLGGSTGLPLVFSTARLGVFVSGPCLCLPLGAEGCVIGALFHRYAPPSPLTTLEEADSNPILQSGGGRLLRRFWGGYVAAIPWKGDVRILRDPSAGLPCYHARADAYALFASDAELLAETGLVRGDVDWEALARHLFNRGVPTGETVLEGVGELLAGFTLEPGDGHSGQRSLWSPWDHVERRAESQVEAAERLALAVKAGVRGWSAGHGRVLLSVSGGLDSSIVAAALAAGPAETICLTMYGEDASGDERAYARALCAHLRLPLIEKPYRLEDIDIAEPLGMHLPRPTDRTQALPYERAHLETAREIGASAFMTGNGGDSVFGYSQSGAAAADRYLAEGLGRGLFRTLRDISVQTGCGLGAASRAAWRIARAPPAYRCRPDPLFLHPDVLAALGPDAPGHAWLDAPAGALPGKAAHIASILRLQQCLEPNRGRHLPVLNPLMSQPVVEACLAVPSWEWRTGGRDRSLARRAFAGNLPALVVRRRVKGGPDGFAAQILKHFRAPIRERLLGGRLAARGLIDRDAVARALDDPGPGDGNHRVRLLEFVAAEAWLDGWATRSRALERRGGGRVRGGAGPSTP